MPLNPPSYAGQDVWYSPNTYVNQVAVALWQPAVAMPSAMRSIPVIPNPPQTIDAAQASAMQAQAGVNIEVDENGNVTRNTITDPPYPGGAPGQQDGPSTESVDPLSNAGGGYGALINNLSRVLAEARGGAWQGSPSITQNLKTMCNTMGLPESLVTSRPTAWCATFVAYMLKLSGLPYLTEPGSNRTIATGRAYQKYAQAIPLQPRSGWRKGDIITIPYEGGSGFHVAFLWGFTSGGAPIALGGNQGAGNGNVSAAQRPDRPVATVRRGWTVPAGSDTPLPYS